MDRNTHATVGQNPGRVLYALADRNLDDGCRQSAARPVLSLVSRPPSPRAGISLTEVLIAMGILTVGLLGVAAIFPVGSYYMQKGDVADRASAIAQAAFNEAISRGVLNPENWLVWNDTGISGVTVPTSIIRNTFLRPFAEMLRSQKASQAIGTWTERDRQRYTAWEFGSVFVIDPIGVAGIAQPVSLGPDPPIRFGGLFPSSFTALATNPNVPEWLPWGDTATQGPRWPVRRVAIKQPYSALPFYKPLDSATADKLFSSSDDLSLDLPTARDKPSIQRLEFATSDLNGDGNTRNDPLSRQSRGDYSWIVTVSPTTAEARDALATNPSAYSYEVSVVVFYKRPLTGGPTTQIQSQDNLRNLQSNERAVRAKIVSSGLSGGEVLLTRLPPVENPLSYEPEESPFDSLKVGQWIFLCGPNPSSTEERPVMTARWYRVLAVDKEADGIITDQPNQRLVSLRGPQWPWKPADNLTYTHLSNALYACIPTGAVAVHSKTIHLEGNSAWSGGAEAISAPTPPGPRYAP